MQYVAAVAKRAPLLVTAMPGGILPVTKHSAARGIFAFPESLFAHRFPRCITIYLAVFLKEISFIQGIMVVHV